MTVFRFSEVSQTFQKRVPCSVCQRPVRRQKTFMQTLNPFNRNADGAPKTAPEIYTELAVKAEQWRMRPESHQKCGGA